MRCGWEQCLEPAATEVHVFVRDQYVAADTPMRPAVLPLCAGHAHGERQHHQRWHTAPLRVVA